MSYLATKPISEDNAKAYLARIVAFCTKIRLQNKGRNRCWS